MISAKQIKELRNKTGASIIEVKSALQAVSGDAKKAVEILRKKGQIKAAKKAGRIAGQGMIDAYIHGEGRIGVLVEVNCETDFVARNQEFKSLVHDLALHIAASNPLYISGADVPADVIAQEKEPEKFFREVCLLEQPFVKDPTINVQELINQKIAVIGENIQVRRFTRYARGE
ncbi:MAG: translation elongation factor Ts [Candidatus Doudnabacteria bacterium]|nr:translation elongation factor Ts [Candidatus Doudnabacteria bacterium]